MKYCDFLIPKENEHSAWLRAFRSVLIMCDFHLKYQAIKMIGKGSFARVYLVEDKKTKEKFAVKAFAKERLKYEE